MDESYNIKDYRLPKMQKPNYVRYHFDHWLLGIMFVGSCFIRVSYLLSNMVFACLLTTFMSAANRFPVLSISTNTMNASSTQGMMNCTVQMQLPYHLGLCYRNSYQLITPLRTIVTVVSTLVSS